MNNIRKLWCPLLFIGLINVGGIILLRHYDLFYRTVPVQEFDALDYFHPYNTPAELERFAAKDPVGIMQNVMNFVVGGRSGKAKSDSIQDIYDHAKSGGSLTCAGMAEIFLHALRLQGYKARKLFVVKSIGDPFATHTLVEVFENGKWVIYDPTFNVSFRKGNQLLGATDIAQSLIDGSFVKIEPIFYGEVVYKARLETYPIHWLAHFNNVLCFKHANYSNSFLIRNTAQLITRYWQGPVLYYFAPNGTPNDYLELLNWFYFFFTCAGPLLFLLLSLWYVFLVGLQILKNKRSRA